MIDYRDKLIAAPMIRISTLPFRLLCLRYGCDLVYTDEIIDYKLTRCKRHVNDLLGTIDYKIDDSEVVFRTCDEEKGRVILQIGTNCPDRALQAAKIVEQDVAGIDINMGCPKEFSVKGGMGSALLENPELIRKILTNLVDNLNVPVTCKIRVLPSLEKTLELVKIIESTKIAAIAVHGRTKNERPNHPNRTDYISLIAESLKIPVIANGDSNNIKTYDDLIRFKMESKASSVMIARAARVNCSIFRKEGKLDRDVVISDYLDLSLKYDNYFALTKYTVQSMKSGNLQTLVSSTTTREIYELFGKADDYDRVTEEFRIKNNDLKRKQIVNNDQVNQESNQTNKVQIDEELNSPTRKKRKLMELIESRREDADEILELKFMKKQFENAAQLPKCVLHRFANGGQNKISYRTVQVEKRFYGICEYDGIKYLNLYLEKNKRYAEQGAALLACFKLNLIDDKIIEKCKVDKPVDPAN